MRSWVWAISLGYSDGLLITNLHNNWVAISNLQTIYLPTLQTYPNLATNLPKVMYWGNLAMRLNLRYLRSSLPGPT